MASKSYGWDVKNIAKISPKMAKKQSFFDFFDFLTNCSYDSNESESEGKRLKPTPLPHMRLWFNYVEETIFMPVAKFLRTLYKKQTVTVLSFKV